MGTRTVIGETTAPASTPTGVRTVLGINRPKPGPGVLPGAGDGSASGMNGQAWAGLLGLIAGGAFLATVTLAARRRD